MNELMKYIMYILLKICNRKIGKETLNNKETFKFILFNLKLESVI